MKKALAGEASLQSYYDSNISAKTLDKVGNTGFGIPAYDFLEMNKYIKKNASLLEIGSGSGRLGIYFLTLCNLKKYIGLEIIDKFTTAFEKKINNYKDHIHCTCELSNTSFLQYKTKDTFDIIALPFGVIEEFKDKKIVLQKLKALLSTGGICLIDCHDYRCDITTLDTKQVKLYPFNYKKNATTLSALGFSHSHIYYECPGKKGFARELVILRNK